jgi:hypothetical protein
VPRLIKALLDVALGYVTADAVNSFQHPAEYYDFRTRSSAHVLPAEWHHLARGKSVEEKKGASRRWHRHSCAIDAARLRIEHTPVSSRRTEGGFQ